MTSNQCHAFQWSSQGLKEFGLETSGPTVKSWHQKGMGEASELEEGRKGASGNLRKKNVSILRQGFKCFMSCAIGYMYILASV